MLNVRAIVGPFDYVKTKSLVLFCKAAVLLAFPHFSSTVPPVSTCLSVQVGVQKRSDFAKFLQLSEAFLPTLSSVSCAALGAPRSFQSIHTHSTSPKMHESTDTNSDPAFVFLPETPAFALAPRAAPPAFLLCPPTNRGLAV